MATGHPQPTASPTTPSATVAPNPTPATTGDTVYRIADDITPPELLTRDDSNSDDTCKGRWVSGVGIYEAVIDKSGNVRDVHALRPPQFKPPCPEFEKNIRARLSKWKYKPATRAGKPVAVYLTVTVLFHF